MIAGTETFPVDAGKSPRTIWNDSALQTWRQQPQGTATDSWQLEKLCT